MDQSTRLLETLVRFRKWMDEGQDLLGSTIPALIQECDRAGQELRQLRQESVDDRNEITMLREHLEQLTHERMEMREAMAACLREISRITGKAMRKFEGTQDRSLAPTATEDHEPPRRVTRRKSPA
jgi:hypothetical protein